MSPDVPNLMSAASQAAASGRWDEAERLWRRALELAPGHAQAHFNLGLHAYRRGDFADADANLRIAAAAAPADPTVAMALAVVKRDAGDPAGEAEWINQALKADPRFLPALLARGEHAERHGDLKAAARAFGAALEVAAAARELTPALRERIAHAKRVIERFSEQLYAFVAERTGLVMAALSPGEQGRWREAAAILCGRTPLYPSMASQLQVPRLPAQPFYERSLFPWAEAIEAETETITAELMALLDAGRPDFHPYIRIPDGAPVDQWRELNQSSRWSSYFLWEHGEAVAAHQAQCPRTTEALRMVDQADIAGLCPNAMYSALAPRTQIPPHHGETNARLVVHLPLIVPPHCHLRVGFDTRPWQPGRLLAFDDSIEHEARNDSDELRVVLIFDVWNPLLSAGERDMVRALAAATREFVPMT